MEELNLKLCLNDMQLLGWLDTSQRRILSSCVDQGAACAFQLLDCDFPNHKDELEGLADHFNEAMTLLFYNSSTPYCRL